MRLSAEQFAELVALLQNRRGERFPGEKRRSGRIAVQAEVPIELISDNERSEPFTVTVSNISARGIALLHAMALQAGQQFVCSLRRQNRRSVSLLCTVMHSTRLSDSLYRIGAEFTCTLGSAAAKNPPAPEEQDRIRQSVLG